MDCSMPGFPVLYYLPELAWTHVHWVSDVIQASHPLLPSYHPLSIFVSTWVFSNDTALCIRWPKHWSFSFSISPSNEYPGLISVRIDWFYLLAIQGAFKSSSPAYSSKASILWRSTFFMVQLSHLHMTTGKTTALTIQTFVGKVMSLLFNMLSRLVLTFHPRSKHLLISLRMAAVTICSDFGAQKNKIRHCFHFSPIYLPWSDGTDAMILVFLMLNFKSAFSLSFSSSSRDSLVPLLYLPLE